MKVTVFWIILFFTLISNAKAQVLKKFLIEADSKDQSVYSNSCESPSNGILVFKSAIKNLNISLYPSSNLLKVAEQVKKIIEQ